MATVTSTALAAEGISYVDEWAGNWSAGDTGSVVSHPGAADRTVEVFGTFSGGASFTLEGAIHKANDDPANIVNWFALHDPQGSALTFTAAGLKAIMENVTHIRPNCTVGTAAAVTVRLLSRSTMS